MFTAFIKNIYTLLPALLFCLPLTATADSHVTPVIQNHSPKTLVIGKVSSNPKKHYRFLKPIADYAAHKMRDLGYQNAKVLMARNNNEMAQYLREGRVDWVTETPFSAMFLHNQAGAELLLRKWKKSVPEYHTVFFVRKDSGIKTIDDIKGKTIAFQDPGSTSAYYIPAYLMIKNGSHLVKLSSPNEKPTQNETGYIFAGEEINMSTWVHKGIVDAAAFSNLDWNKEDSNPRFFRKDYMIIHKSRNYPRAIELVRQDLPTEVKNRLKEILLKIHEDPEAESALQAYQKTKKFDLVTPSIMKTLKDTESILNTVNKTLE